MKKISKQAREVEGEPPAELRPPQPPARPAKKKRTKRPALEDDGGGVVEEPHEKPRRNNQGKRKTTATGSDDMTTLQTGEKNKHVRRKEEKVPPKPFWNAQAKEASNVFPIPPANPRVPTKGMQSHCLATFDLLQVAGGVSAMPSKRWQKEQAQHRNSSSRNRRRLPFPVGSPERSSR